MSVYPFIEAEKVEHRNVSKACALMEVSRSALYGKDTISAIAQGNECVLVTLAQMTRNALDRSGPAVVQASTRKLAGALNRGF